MPADAYFRWVSFRKEGSATALGAPRLVVGPTRMMVRARRTSLAAAVSLCVLSGWLGAISVVDGFSFLPPRRLARTITLSAAEAATKVSSARSMPGRAVSISRARRGRRSSRWAAMSGDGRCDRRSFLGSGLALLFTSAAAVTSSSPQLVAAAGTVVEEAGEDDEAVLDDITKQIMDTLTQALTSAESDDGEIGLDRGPTKEVLKGSSEQLPNRAPFEMQYEMFKRGMELEDENNYLGAERQWTEIIENFNSPNFRANSPGNKFLLARAYNNRGNTRLSLQKTREAILDFSESIDLVPEKGEFWLARGVAYEDMADRKVLANERNVKMARTFYESALADYDHALVLDPQDPRVYVSRGDANTLLGQSREALDNYRHAVSLSPMVPEFRSKVALAEIEIGNIKKGAFLIGQLLQRYPNYPEMLLAGAAVAWEEGDLVEGQAMYNEAIRTDPRLLDEDFIWLILRWPEQPLAMVRTLRSASKAPKGSGLDALGLPSLLQMPREII